MAVRIGGWKLGNGTAEEELADRVEKVLALHSVGVEGHPPHETGRCWYCDEVYPCKTRRTLDGEDE
jgi:hypothetical protein